MSFRDEARQYSFVMPYISLVDDWTDYADDGYYESWERDEMEKDNDTNGL